MNNKEGIKKKEKKSSAGIQERNKRTPRNPR
jgi:hypothetical protein